MINNYSNFYFKKYIVYLYINKFNLFFLNKKNKLNKKIFYINKNKISIIKKSINNTLLWK